MERGREYFGNGEATTADPSDLMAALEAGHPKIWILCCGNVSSGWGDVCSKYLTALATCSIIIILVDWSEVDGLGWVGVA